MTTSWNPNLVYRKLERACWSSGREWGRGSRWPKFSNSSLGAGPGRSRAHTCACGRCKRGIVGSDSSRWGIWTWSRRVVWLGQVRIWPNGSTQRLFWVMGLGFPRKRSCLTMLLFLRNHKVLLFVSHSTFPSLPA